MSLLQFWKKRKKQSHKGENGKVLVVGGSKGYVGAVALAGVAALRSGADLVTVVAPEKVAWAVNCLSPDLITVKIKGNHFTTKHIKKVANLAKEADVILLGNGLGLKSSTFVNGLIKEIKNPLVIDADALKCVTSVQNAILTPHKKEFEIFSKKRLSGKLQKDLEIIKKAAGKNVILLKGKVDIIANKDKYKLNKRGNPGMTKGGTGDVLAGVCAGFLAQGMNPFDAAYEAVKLITSLGDKIAKKKGYSFLASDLLKDIKKLHNVKLKFFFKYTH